MLKQWTYRILLSFLLFPVLSLSTIYGEKKEPVSLDKKLSVSEQRKLDYFFYEGIYLKNAQKYDAAYDMFVHCLSIDSTAAPVLFELATFYIQEDHLDKALDFLRRAVANSNNNFTYRMALASVSRNLGLFGEAAETFEQLAKTYPEKMELNYYLAESLTQQGKIAEAIEAYDALESAIGMSEALSVQKYKLYSALDQPENAFGEIEKLAAKYPMVARYQMILGDLRLEGNEPDKAYAHYQKAKEVEPENPYYIVSMANYYEVIGDNAAAERQIHNALINETLDVETKLSILSRYIMRTTQARDDSGNINSLFQTLLEQHPEETEIKMMYASLLVAQEKMDEAKFQMQLVTEMEPENVGAWQQLLSLSLQSEDLPEVIRVCKQCMELFPEAPEYYFYLGVAYYQQKEYRKALDTYYEGLNIIPEENLMLKSDFYAQTGDIYYQMGSPDEAFNAYEEALKYNDKNIVVLNNYSYFLSLEKKDLGRAERMSAQTIKMEPNNSTYLDTYAWIFFMQGNYSLAKIYIETALKNDMTNSTELIDHYGDILYMSGEKERAVEQWKKAKELGKESPVLDRKIEEGTYFEEENAK